MIKKTQTRSNKKRFTFDKGRYTDNGLTGSALECFKTKVAMRRMLMDTYYEGGGLFEAYYGTGKLYRYVFSKYNIQQHIACDKQIKAQDYVHLCTCEELMRTHNFEGVRVLDFDHHGFPLRAFAQFMDTHANEESYIVFLTIGIAPFSRKTILNKNSVYYKAEADDKIQLNWNIRDLIMDGFVQDACEANGYKINYITRKTIKTLVRYYAIHIIRT